MHNNEKFYRGINYFRGGPNISEIFGPGGPNIMGVQIFRYRTQRQITIHFRSPHISCKADILHSFKCALNSTLHGAHHLWNNSFAEMSTTWNLVFWF